MQAPPGCEKRQCINHEIGTAESIDAMHDGNLRHTQRQKKKDPRKSES